MDRLTGLTAAVAGHLLVHGAHGAVHASVPVPTTGWRLGYVVVVLFVAPVVGLVVAHRGRLRAGAAVVAVAGAAGLAFEVGFHFVLATPDNVGHVPSGVLPFAATAALSTLGSLALLVVGSLVWIRSDRGVR